MQLKDLAAEVLLEAKRQGATGGDVLVAETTSFSVTVRLGQIEKLTHAQAKRLGLRLFLGQSSALSSTADLTWDSLRQLVQQTLDMARATAADPFSGLPDASDLAKEPPDLDLYDERALTLTPEEKISLAQKAEAAALEADPRIVNSEGAEFASTATTLLYANTHGFTGQYPVSSFSLYVVPVASQNGLMQRDYWYTSHRKWDHLEAAEVVGKKAARRALRRLGARRVKTQKAPVVFEPEMAASLLRHLAVVVSGSSLYRGTSFLLGKLGQKIAADGVTVEDNGLIPSALGSRPFDGEGLPTRPIPVIQNGILSSYLLDTYAARKLGLRPTGHAARSFADTPSAAPTNFYLKPGPHTPEDIIRSVRSGLYVTELIGFGFNPTTGDYSRGAAGLWIQDGELTTPVEEITIAGNLLAMLQNIEMVGNDLELRRTLAAPTLKIAEMTIAGD